MKKLLLVMLLFVGCQSRQVEQVPQQSVIVKSEFAKLQDRFFEDYWVANPDSAMYLGNPDYPAVLTVYDKSAQKRELDFYLKYKKIFKNVDRKKLTLDESTDLDVLQNLMNQSVWYLTVFKKNQWDPSVNNVGNAIGTIWENQKRTQDEKLRLLTPILAQVTAYYHAGYENIKNPTLEHINLAIKQNKGTLSYLEKSFPPAVAKSGLSQAEKEKFSAQLVLAQAGIREYLEKLEKLKTGKKFRSFRLSREMYKQKFQYDLETIHSADEIYKSALKQRNETHVKMADIAEGLWPKYFPNEKPPANPRKMVQQVLEKISLQHVSASEFLPSIRKQIPELWDFVVKHNLLDLDKNKPLKVRETPEYQRGVAGASIDAPGLFEPHRDTYYNVTPPSDLPPEAQESYLREYNNYMLQILNIHEAIPGHYAQLVYSNKVSSRVKQIFGNGPMVEGWAVYAERMMLEEGYGNNQPELWLMYYKWFLRVSSNTILDYSIHNLGMTKEQGMNLLVNQSFQQQAEAEEKWNRATLTQVQLASYFAGFSEIYSFREEQKKKLGAKFNLKKFHDKFLSFGSVPVKTIIKSME